MSASHEITKPRVKLVYSPLVIVKLLGFAATVAFFAGAFLAEALRFAGVFALAFVVAIYHQPIVLPRLLVHQLALLMAH